MQTRPNQVSDQEVKQRIQEAKLNPAVLLSHENLIRTLKAQPTGQQPKSAK